MTSRKTTLQACVGKNQNEIFKILLIARNLANSLTDTDPKNGDGVAQLVDHRLELQRSEVRTPSGAEKKM